MSIEQLRLAIVPRFGLAATGLHWEPVAQGGFSGAALWRGETSDRQPRFALKAYPPAGISAERLRAIHAWLRGAGNGVPRLPFVPLLLHTTEGETAVLAGNRFWEVTQWLPGRADFHDRPTRPRLEAACAALATLHRAWQTISARVAPAPGVLRRLQSFADFRARAVGPNRPRFAPVLDDAIRRGEEQVRRWLPVAERALVPWASRPFALQPCLCDVWHDHVLFTGDAVTGLIDYGSMKVDHVAVDLARLLGSLVPEDEEAFGAGLTAYRAAGGSREVPEGFVRLLARTGTLGGVIGWLSRLATSTASAVNVGAVAARLTLLVSQLERLPAPGPFDPSRQTAFPG